MSADDLLRKKALSYVHLCYRNTFIEDLHSECKALDLKIYEDVLSFICKKLALIRRYDEYTDLAFVSPAKLLELKKSMPAEAMELVMDVMFNQLMGSNWDAAEECEYDGTEPA